MIKVDPFDQFDKHWALLTAGNAESFNTMTISWGMMGTLWGLPVAEVFVRPQRYTREFMEREEWFTVSFFPEEYKKDLALLGTLSGRDLDKLAKTGLHPEKVGDSVGFEEAELTLLCKKLYWQDLDPDRIPEEVKEKYYPDCDWHRAYIGQVVEIIAQ